MSPPLILLAIEIMNLNSTIPPQAFHRDSTRFHLWFPQCQHLPFESQLYSWNWWASMKLQYDSLLSIAATTTETAAVTVVIVVLIP